MFINCYFYFNFLFAFFEFVFRCDKTDKRHRKSMLAGQKQANKKFHQRTDFTGNIYDIIVSNRATLPLI